MLNISKNIRIAPGAFGITPERIRSAMNKPRTPSGTTAAFRDVSRNVNQIIANSLRETVANDAAAIRRAIDERGISVTGYTRDNIRARGTGRRGGPGPSYDFSAPDANTRRLIDLEYPKHLEYISFGTGPQGFPPARKVNGQTILVNKDNWDDFSPSPYQGQYGLLDWIEMKGLTSEKYDNAYQLYKAIGGAIKWGGIKGVESHGILDTSQRDYGSLGRSLFQGGLEAIGEEWLGLSQTYDLQQRSLQAAERAARQMFDIFASFYTGPSRDKVEALRGTPVIEQALDNLVNEVRQAYSRA